MTDVEKDAFGRPVERKRYLPGARKMVPPWGTRWNLVAWPLTCACPNYAAFVAVCRKLTKWAEHTSNPGDGQVPTASMGASATISVVEDRVVTRAMSGPDQHAKERVRYLEFQEVERQLGLVSRGRRRGQPWAWGEAWRVFKYTFKLTNGAAEDPRRITEQQFLLYLDRAGDEDLLTELMGRAATKSYRPTDLERSADQLCRPASGVPGPAHPSRVDRTEELVGAFVRADPFRMGEAWAALHKHLWEPFQC